MGLCLPKPAKTNVQWYPYKDMGAYYRLEDGVLMVAYMERDGSISTVDGEVNEGEVDWELLEGEYLDVEQTISVTGRLSEIRKELRGKE